MLLSAVSVLVVVQSSSEIPEGLMNNPVQRCHFVTLHDDEGMTRSKEFGVGRFTLNKPCKC